MSVYHETLGRYRENQYKKQYLNKYVHVVINDPYHPMDATGFVKFIDAIGQLHGTWGGLAAYPLIDEVEVLDDIYYKYKGYYIIKNGTSLPYVIYDKDFNPIQYAHSLDVSRRIINMVYLKK